MTLACRGPTALSATELRCDPQNGESCNNYVHLISHLTSDLGHLKQFKYHLVYTGAGPVAGPEHKTGVWTRRARSSHPRPPRYASVGLRRVLLACGRAVSSAMRNRRPYPIPPHPRKQVSFCRTTFSIILPCVPVMTHHNCPPREVVVGV